MMKIAQKIETGGNSNTSTPIFKFLTKMLFDPSDARHITHCAMAESEHSATRAATAIAINIILIKPGLDRIDIILGPNAFRREPAVPDNATPWPENYPGKIPTADRWR